MTVKARISQLKRRGPRGKYMIGMSPIGKFEANYIPVPESGCWLWIAGDNGVGYGKLTIKNKHIYAHRFSYEFYRGKVPKGYDLDHLCRVRCCVNPTHLEPVSRKINLMRGVRKTLLPKRSCCMKGHEYTEKNTRIWTYKGRIIKTCRTCANHNARERLKRRKNASQSQNFVR